MKDAFFNCCDKCSSILKFTEDDAFEVAFHKVALNGLDRPPKGSVVANIGCIRCRVKNQLNELTKIFFFTHEAAQISQTANFKHILPIVILSEFFVMPTNIRPG